MGKIGIGEEDGSITDLCFGTCKETQNIRVYESDLLKKAALQLEEYLHGSRKEFDLPLAPKGTEFQKKDWQALRTIPYGKTATYGEIAKQIGCPKGARAVGLANNRNPISIIIPCHRVIGAGGKLVGYGGGLDIKKRLLQIEGAE